MVYKSIIFIVFSIFLIGCTGSHSTHLGCQEGEVIDGQCVVAVEGEQNVDLFDSLDSLDVETEEVDYGAGVTGFLAEPVVDLQDETVSFPAVIMIHEWWGLNDNIKDMARLLANEGYVVLAVDLYGEYTDDSSRARELATSVRENPDGAVENMNKAAEFLRSLPQVNKDSLGSMGWCFGGQQSLQLALSGEELAATVIYYGHLNDNKEELSVIDHPILGIFGQEDTSITPADVDAFKQALDEVGIENDITNYPGVGHAFANPSGSRYAPDETKDAWEKTVTFLNSHLKQ